MCAFTASFIGIATRHVKSWITVKLMYSCKYSVKIVYFTPLQKELI